MNRINWNPAGTPAELHKLLSTLEKDYPVFKEAETGIRFKQVDTPGYLSVGSDIIEYNTVSNAARGIGMMLADLKVVEKVEFSTLGIMLDCSRNAVMTVDHTKKWLRQIALMGYNMAMLYTEDTFQLPEEPYFGYMRGAYSLEEIKEIDDYADALGVELIPCIQVLGHLEQILHWEHYAGIRDTSSVLMVDADETYRLICKILDFWSKAVRTRRIHIGMDETHDLGRGKFMDKFGYERGFEIFNRHLTKVNAMCVKAGFKPMIWSDMYFRMGNERSDYYAKDTVIPEEVKNAIPDNVELVL